MQAAPLFTHIRIVLGIVLGLALTTLLKGMARFVQPPGRERIYWCTWAGRSRCSCCSPISGGGSSA